MNGGLFVEHSVRTIKQTSYSFYDGLNNILVVDLVEVFFSFCYCY